MTLSVRSPGEKLSAVRALRAAADTAALALAPAERAAWNGYRSSVGPEQATHAACLLILSQVEALSAQLADGVEMLGATVRPAGVVEIRPSTEYRPVASGGSIQGPAMRHWLCLRDALSALDAHPEWPEDVARAFAAYDEAWAPVRSAEASRSALLDLPEAEREAPAWQTRYEAASEAVRSAEETCAPLRQEIYQSEVGSGYRGPAVEMVRRRAAVSEGE